MSDVDTFTRVSKHWFLSEAAFTSLVFVFAPIHQDPLAAVKKLSFYDALGVKLTSGAKELKAAFNKLAIHPADGGDPAVFEHLQECLRTLLNPKLRKVYDSGGDEVAQQLGAGTSVLEPLNFGMLNTLVVMKGSGQVIVSGVCLRVMLLNLRARPGANMLHFIFTTTRQVLQFHRVWCCIFTTPWLLLYSHNNLAGA
jgi:hypothetical protein